MKTHKVFQAVAKYHPFFSSCLTRREVGLQVHHRGGGSLMLSAAGRWVICGVGEVTLAGRRVSCDRALLWLGTR